MRWMPETYPHQYQAEYRLGEQHRALNTSIYKLTQNCASSTFRAPLWPPCDSFSRYKVRPSAPQGAEQYAFGG